MLAKTVTPARITENLKSTELKLDEEDVRKIRKLERNCRLFKVCMTVSQPLSHAVIIMMYVHIYTAV